MLVRSKGVYANSMLAHILVASVIAVRIVNVASCTNGYTALNATNFVKAVAYKGALYDHIGLVKAEAAAYTHTTVKGRLAFVDDPTKYNISVALMKDQSIEDAWIGLRCFGGGDCRSIDQFKWSEDGNNAYMDVDWAAVFNSDSGYDCLKIDINKDGLSEWDDRACSDVWTGAIYELSVEDPCASNPCTRSTGNCITSCLLADFTYSCVAPATCASGYTGKNCHVTLEDWANCQHENTFYLASTDKCYHISTVEKTAGDSHNYCTENGFRHVFAVILSSEENTFIHEKFRTVFGSGSGVLYVRIAGYRDAGGMQWQQTTGTLTYHNFDSAYTDVNQCVTLEPNGWLERNCNSDFRSVCRKSAPCSYPFEWDTSNQMCLLYGGLPTNFETARNLCGKDAAELVYTETSQQNQYLRDYVNGEHWIGLKRGTILLENGVYKFKWNNDKEWLNGLAVNAGDWRQTSLCMRYDWDNSIDIAGKWHPCSDSSAYRFVCEKTGLGPSAPVLATTTVDPTTVAAVVSCPVDYTGSRCDMTMTDWDKCNSDNSYYLAATNSCYQVLSKTGGYYSNGDRCAAYGGGMVGIHSDEENTFVYDVAMKLPSRTSRVMLGMYRTSRGWVGRSHYEDNRLTYHKFDPDYLNAECVVLNDRSRWDERSCYETKRTLCKDTMSGAGCNSYWSLDVDSEQCFDVPSGETDWMSSKCSDNAPRAYFFSDRQCETGKIHTKTALGSGPFEVWIGLKRSALTQDGGGTYQFDYNSGVWVDTNFPINRTCWEYMGMCMIVDGSDKDGRWTPCEYEGQLTTVCEKPGLFISFSHST